MTFLHLLAPQIILQKPKSSISQMKTTEHVSTVSNHYCPDRNKFKNYKALTGCYVITADSHRLKAIGIGDVHIELPNKSK